MSADTIPLLIQSLLFDSLVLAFLVFGILAAAAGIGLITCRDRTMKLISVMNRHVSTRQALKSVSVQHDITQTVQRYRWWFAGGIIAGAVYSMYILLTRFDASLVNAALEAPGPFALAVAEGLRWFMIAFSGIACLIGILLGFFPDTLQTIEALTNRWYSMRQITAPLETPRPTLDRWVASHPLLAGWSITLGALIVVISSVVILFGK
jgi:type II secretory pathway pseudopilin PulG